MINLQPLIEKFKKAVYGRDVRQSIVDLAQAIGDNHNEQEGLRDEVKSLDSDINVKKEEAEQAINIAISSVNSAKTEAEKSINTAINALNSGKEEIDNLANAKGEYLKSKTQSLKQALNNLAETKDKEIRNTADGKIDEITTTATTESDKIKGVITTANKDLEVYQNHAEKTCANLQIASTNAIDAKQKLEEATEKALELQGDVAVNLHDFEVKLRNNEVVTKKDLDEKVKSLISPQILAINSDDFIWYISSEDINFYSANADITDTTKRIEAYCNIKLSEVKEKITRNGIKASLNVTGWDRTMANNIPFTTPNTQVFANLAGLKEARLFSNELKENSANVCWESSKDEEVGADARIFIKLVSFY